jgi:hypothetical protein
MEDFIRDFADEKVISSYKNPKNRVMHRLWEAGDADAVLDHFLKNKAMQDCLNNWMSIWFLKRDTQADLDDLAGTHPAALKLIRGAAKHMSSTVFSMLFKAYSHHCRASMPKQRRGLWNFSGETTRPCSPPFPLRTAPNGMDIFTPLSVSETVASEETIDKAVELFLEHGGLDFFDRFFKDRSVHQLPVRQWSLLFRALAQRDAMYGTCNWLLKTAISADDPLMLMRLIEISPYPLVVDPATTTMYLAGNAEAVRFLVSKGVAYDEASIPREYGEYPPLCFARSKDVVDALLDVGSDASRLLRLSIPAAASPTCRILPEARVLRWIIQARPSFKSQMTVDLLLPEQCQAKSRCLFMNHAFRYSNLCESSGTCRCFVQQPILPFVELISELGLSVPHVEKYAGKPEYECALFTFKYIPFLSPEVLQAALPATPEMERQDSDPFFFPNPKPQHPLLDRWFRWRPHTHRFHGPRVKARVFCTLLVFHRLLPLMPKEMVIRILTLAIDE